LGGGSTDSCPRSLMCAARSPSGKRQQVRSRQERPA
jgi:hypothetical protein